MLSALTLHQRPDHLVHLGDTVLVDGDPFVITAIKPHRWMS